MKKGVYSAVVGLTALVIIISIAASTGQRIAMEEDSIYASSMTEMKIEWQNMRYLLDKTAADAIADAVIVNCTNTDVETKIATYMQNIAIGNCQSVYNVNVTEYALNKYDITAMVSCEKSFAPSKRILYEKEVVLEKELEISGTSPCTFTVTDVQSGLQEYPAP